MDELDVLFICTTYYNGSENDMIKDLPRINKLLKLYDTKTIEMINLASRVGSRNMKKLIKSAFEERNEPGLIISEHPEEQTVLNVREY